MKKLLKIALTILMVISTGVVNVAADTSEVKKIVYHGNGATSVETSNEFIFNDVNTDERNYIQTGGITTTEGVTVSFKAAENHFKNNNLPGTMFVGWGTTQGATTAVITPAEISQNLDIKLQEKGLAPDQDGVLHLYAVWSGVLNVVFKNIDGSNYADINPNDNISISLEHVSNGKTFKILNATKEQSAFTNNTEKDVFGGWFYKDGSTWKKLDTEKVNGVDTFVINESVYNKFAKTDNSYTGGTLELYAKWYYTVNYDLTGTEAASLGNDDILNNFNLPATYTSGSTTYYYSINNIPDAYKTINYSDGKITSISLNYQRRNAQYEMIYDADFLKGNESNWYNFPTFGNALGSSYQFNFGNITVGNNAYHFNYWEIPNSGYKFATSSWNQDQTFADSVNVEGVAHTDTKSSVVTVKPSFEKFVELTYYYDEKATTNPNYKYVLASANDKKIQDLTGISGYEFDGWASSNLLTNATKHPNTLYNTDQLKTFWAKFNYSVVYDANGGVFPTANNNENSETLNQDKTVLTKTGFVYNIKNKVFPSKTPTKEGYSFVGWMDAKGVVYTDQNQKENDIPTVVGVHKLTAVWTPKTYTVRLDANDPLNKLVCNDTTHTHTHTKGCYSVDDGASRKVVMPSEYRTNHKDNRVDSTQDYFYALTKTYDTDLGIDSKLQPTRDGYTFKGWFTAPTGGTKVISDYYAGQVLNDGTDDDDLFKELDGYSSGTVYLYAQWEAKTYSIVFDINKPHKDVVVTDNKGTMSNQTGVAYNASITINSNQYGIDGYTFVGWAKDPNGNVMYDENSSTTIGNSIEKYASLKDTLTLYAKWRANSYSVVFNMNVNDSSARIDTTTYNNVSLNSGMDANTTCKKYTTVNKVSYDATTTTPVPTRTGYQFAGWYDSNNNLVTDIKNLVKADNGSIELKAHWTNNSYTIKAVLNGGSYSSTPDNWNKDSENNYYIAATYDNTHNGNRAEYTLTEPTRTGYVFQGWYKDNGSTIVSDSNTTLAGFQVYNTTEVQNGETVYTAQWTPITYSITFDGNKGSGSTDVTLKLGNNTFNGSYTATYDVRYKQPNASRDGYSFDGWYWCDDSTHTNCDGCKLLKADEDIYNIFNTNGKSRTYYAHWTPNKYTIVFHDNKQNSEASLTGSMDNQVFDFDSSVNITSNAYTLEGYDFAGWSTSASTNKVYDNNAEIKVDKDNFSSMLNTINLYAKWTTHTFDVKLNFNDSKNNNGSTAATASSPLANYTWDDNNKVYDRNSNLNYENSESLPVLSRNGYVFDGWYTELTGGTRVDKDGTDNNAQAIAKPLNMFNSTNNATVTLYAHWTPVKYTVKFDANKPTNSSAALTGTMVDQVFNFDETISITNLYELQGYDFTNWLVGSSTSTSTLAGGNFKIDNSNFSTYGSMSTINLYANWTTHGFTVRLNYNDKDNGNGTTSASATTATSNSLSGYSWNTIEGKKLNVSQKLNYENANALPELTRVGYTFDGWFTALNGGTRVDADNSGNAIEKPLNKYTDADNGIVTLYAHWTAKTFTVNFNFNRPSKVQDQGNITVDNLQLLTNFEKVEEYAKYKYVETFDVNTYILPELSLRGYKFDGWYTAQTGGTVVSDLTNFALNSAKTELAESVDVYAHWTANNYKIVLDLNDVSVTNNPTLTPDASWGSLNAGYSISNNQYTINSTYDNYYSLVKPVLAGYVFDGWYTEKVGGTKLTVNNSKVDANATETVEHTFDGAASSVECLVNQTATNGETVRYYAHWTPVTTTIKLHNTLNSSHASTDSCATVEVTFDATVNNVVVPTESGYRFLGFYDKQQSNDAVNGTDIATKYFDAEGNYAISGNIWNNLNYTAYSEGADTQATFDFYAWWSYDVRVHSNGGVIYYKTNTGNSPSVLGDFNGNLAQNEVVQIKDISLYGANPDSSSTNQGLISLSFNNKYSSADYSSSNTYNLAVRSTATKDSVYVNGNNNLLLPVEYVGLYKEGYTLAGFVKVNNLASKCDSNGVLKEGSSVDYAVDAVLNNAGTNYNDFDLYAAWVENTYKVVFHNTNVGTNESETKDQVYRYTELSTLDSITFSKKNNTNKLLTSWNTKANGTGTRYSLTQSVSKLTNAYNGVIDLYSVWSDGYAVEYLPTYKTSNGNPELGWSDNSYQSAFPTNVTNNNNVIVQKGTEAGTLQKDYWLFGSDITRVGYVFEGFYKDPNGTQSISTINNAAFNSQANTFTVYVKWTEVEKYAVTFNANGGNFGIDEDSLPITVVNKDFVYNVAQDITNPTRVGYTFTGWYKTAEGAAANNEELLVSDSQYATGTKYFESNSVVGSKGNIVLTSDSVTVKNPMFGETAKTVYAGWKANHYTVTYHAPEFDGTKNTFKDSVNILADYTIAGESKLEKVSVYDDKEYVTYGQEKAAEYIPTLNDYQFVSWNDSSSNTVSTNNSGTLTKVKAFDDMYDEAAYLEAVKGNNNQGVYNIDIYSKFTPLTYSVVFNKNNDSTSSPIDNIDVSGMPANFTKTFDTEKVVTEEPTRIGYKFVGWSTNETTVNIEKFDDTNLGSGDYHNLNGRTINVYAIWSPEEGYNIAFDKNDDTTLTSSTVIGSIANTAKVNYKGELNLPADITLEKTGYTFSGWSLTKYNYGDTVTESTLIKYDAANNKYTNTKIGLDGTIIHTYDLVKLDSSKYNGSEKDITLYAVWTPHKYTVVFDKNDGNNAIKATGTMANKSLTFDENYYQDGVALTANAYKRAGYTFGGWLVTTGALENQSLDNLAKVKNLTTENNGTVTLKAKWVANNSAVVVANGNTVALTGATAWIDGQPATVNTDGTVSVDADAKVLTVYTFTTSTDAYNDGVANHNVKPATMKVYKLTTLADGNKVATELTAFDNIFEYRGTSIRLTGNKGIRIKTGIEKTDRDALLNAAVGLDGYYALEYGTVMAWKDSINEGTEPDLDYVTVGKAAKGYAYNRSEGYDKVFEWKNNNATAVFTNVLTGSWTKEQCAKDFAMRPYVILRPVNATSDKTDIVVYGATVYRSIQYVANQALNAVGQNPKLWYYATNSSEYNFFVNSLGGTARTTANYYGPVEND